MSWTSKAQKTVALSLTEAEYMALSDCSRQVVWMHTLMGELSYHLKPIPIYGNNQGSIFIASNPVTEKWSKHIEICFHFIREVIEKKLAEVFFINGDKNPADLLTKNLGSIKFLLFRNEYGLAILEGTLAECPKEVGMYSASLSRDPCAVTYSPSPTTGVVVRFIASWEK